MMKKRMIAVLLALLMCASTACAEQTAKVKGGWLRLRALPDTASQTITSLPTGTTVTVHSNDGSWCYVTIPDGRSGYMSARYLDLAGDPAVSYVTSANGRDVRLRKGPGTNYEVIGLYPVGTKVQIISQSGDWCYIRISGSTGYMMREFISGSTAPVQKNYTAYVTSENGGRVRMREGAGTNYGVLAAYAPGTKVTVLEHGAAWDHVTTGGKTGYMMTKYLTTTPPHVVSSVTISSYVPNVGMTLVASAVPENTAVSFTWQDHTGRTLGTGRTYTVKTTDVGKRIRVQATIPGQAAKVISAYTLEVAWGSGSSSVLSAAQLSSYTPEVNDLLSVTYAPAGAQTNCTWYRANGTRIGTGSSYAVRLTDVGHRIYCVVEGVGQTTGLVTTPLTAEIPRPAAIVSALEGTVSLPARAVVGQWLTPSMQINTNLVEYAWYINGSLAGNSTSLQITNEMRGAIIMLIVRPSTADFTGELVSDICIVE